MYSNIITAYKILPVSETVASAERFFSKLKISKLFVILHFTVTDIAFSYINGK